MIEAFSLATAHLFQDALASQARLRYRVFVQQRGLPHSAYDGLEFDEFDTPAAIYLVWRDEDRIVRGLARLLRTDRPYMLKTYWPHLVQGRSLPSTPDVWEITRVCIDKAVAPSVRRTIVPELLSAVEEFFLEHGITGMVGVTREHLLGHFLRDGIEWIGERALIEGEIERAFFVPTTRIRPHYHCEKYGIRGAALATVPLAQARNAA
jgi:acyl homoserine lactone synthase